MHRLLLATALLATAQVASASTVEFDFQGNGGFGLLPGNEVGANTSVGSDSTAFGDEIGSGIVYNEVDQTLFFAFDFEGIGGLFTAAASGIHLHLDPTDPDTDPFDQTGPIAFNLNSFTDDNVLNGNDPIADGATSGSVAALIDFSNGALGLSAAELEEALFDGRFYLNIHSAEFTGGELRANLVPTLAVPEPTTLGLLGLCGVGLVARQRRR